MIDRAGNLPSAIDYPRAVYILSQRRRRRRRRRRAIYYPSIYIHPTVEKARVAISTKFDGRGLTAKWKMSCINKSKMNGGDACVSLGLDRGNLEEKIRRADKIRVMKMNSLLINVFDKWVVYFSLNGPTILNKFIT